MLFNIKVKLQTASIFSVALFLLSILGYLNYTGFFALENDINISAEITNNCAGEESTIRILFEKEINEVEISFLNFTEICYNCKYFEKNILLPEDE
ncbi:MAG: hypothetical protein QXT38_00885, partial [Candidatus Aenigmatarchaeota archaeon]